jgi:hypothetical protein
MAATNREGLTWVEWVAAALLTRGGASGYVKLDTRLQGKLRKAWQSGEDPTEWCAFLSDKDFHPEASH